MISAPWLVMAENQRAARLLSSFPPFLLLNSASAPHSVEAEEG